MTMDSSLPEDPQAHNFRAPDSFDFAELMPANNEQLQSFDTVLADAIENRARIEGAVEEDEVTHAYSGTLDDPELFVTLSKHKREVAGYSPTEKYAVSLSIPQEGSDDFIWALHYDLDEDSVVSRIGSQQRAPTAQERDYIAARLGPFLRPETERNEDQLSVNDRVLLQTVRFMELLASDGGEENSDTRVMAVVEAASRELGLLSTKNTTYEVDIQDGERVIKTSASRTVANNGSQEETESRVSATAYRADNQTDEGVLVRYRSSVIDNAIDGEDEHSYSARFYDESPYEEPKGVELSMEERSERSELHRALTEFLTAKAVELENIFPKEGSPEADPSPLHDAGSLSDFELRQFDTDRRREAGVDEITLKKLERLKVELGVLLVA